MTNLANDLSTRMAPSAEDIVRAARAIRTEGTEMAITPILFPGKEYGIWTADVEVETTSTAIACNNDDTYRAATAAAETEAARLMGERPGTVGYVVHRTHNGESGWAVFESILSPLELLRFARSN